MKFYGFFIKKPLLFKARDFFVRIEGLEPTCLAALDPKSSASANFAISAWCSLFGDAKVHLYFE